MKKLYKIRRLYYKYLIPLISIMSMALLLGGILIAVLIFQQISKTEATIKEQAKKEFIKDVQFKHKTTVNNLKNDLTNTIAELNIDLFRLVNSVDFRKMNISKIREEIDSLFKKDSNILELKIINQQARADYAHCDYQRLYSDDIGIFYPHKIFNEEYPKFVSKTYIDVESQESYQYIGYPIKNSEGNVQSCLMVRYGLDFIKDSLQLAHNQAQGNFYVLDQNKRLIGQSNGRLEINKFQTIPFADQLLIHNQLMGSEWNDKLISFFKNRLDWTFVLETSHAQAIVPVNEKLANIKADFNANNNKILLVIVGVILGLVLLFGLIGISVARSVTRPIAHLIDGVRQVTKGDLEVQIPTTTNDEIGELTTSFNDMTTSLKDYKQKIQEHTSTITQQAKKLAFSNDELKHYAHTVSHDLKSPLRTISSYVNLVERKNKNQLDHETQQYFDYIKNGTKRMNRLIEDMLTYARLDQAIKKSDFCAIDLNQILNQVVQDLTFMIKENNAEVVFAGLPKIYGHPTQIHSLFQNLISNSIKYRREESPKVTIMAHIKQNICVIILEDNGRGIDSKALKDIFKPFRRVKENDVVEGSGIGLATVKKILNHHNGTIGVESELGKGSTFYITLPIKKLKGKSKSKMSVLKSVDNQELVQVSPN